MKLSKLIIQSIMMVFVFLLIIDTSFADVKVYDVGNSDVSKPAKIIDNIEEKDIQSDYMVDPVAPNFIPNKIVKRKVRKRKAVKLKIKPARLSFKKMLVKGHFSQPAIQFDRDLLPLGRADEPIEKEFLHKVHQVDFAH